MFYKYIVAHNIVICCIIFDFLSIAGSVYIFAISNNGTTISFVQKLTAPDAAAGDYFGRSVSVDGAILAVGATGDDDNGLSDSGRRSYI